VLSGRVLSGLGLGVLAFRTSASMSMPAACGGEPVGEHGPVGVGEQPGLELLGQGAPAVCGRCGVAERAGDPGAQGVLLAGVGGGRPAGAGGGEVVVRDVVGGSPHGEVGEQVTGTVGAEQRRSPGRGAGGGPGAGPFGDLLGE